VINPELHWVKVEAITSYQRITAELQLRGRLRETISDPEAHLRFRSVQTEPLLPGAPRLQGVPEGMVNKAFVSLVWTIEPEPPPPDDVPEKTRRYVLVQGAGYTLKGYAEFPAAADPGLHSDMLLKGHFFPVHDATVGFVGADGHTWERPVVWVNRDLMITMFMQ
jgi:hypothetical protein